VTPFAIPLRECGRHEGEPVIGDADENYIAMVVNDDARAEIIRRVNAHDHLLAALKEALSDFRHDAWVPMARRAVTEAEAA